MLLDFERNKGAVDLNLKKNWTKQEKIKITHPFLTK